MDEVSVATMLAGYTMPMRVPSSTNSPSQEVLDELEDIGIDEAKQQKEQAESIKKKIENISGKVPSLEDIVHLRPYLARTQCVLAARKTSATQRIVDVDYFVKHYCSVCMSCCSELVAATEDVNLESWKTKGCGHRFCKECLSAHIKCGLDQRRSTICCPSCEQSLTHKDVRRIAGDAEADRLQDILRDEHMQRDRKDVSELLALEGVSKCPKCDVIIFKDGGCPTINCTCGHTFSWGAPRDTTMEADWAFAMRLQFEHDFFTVNVPHMHMMAMGGHGHRHMAVPMPHPGIHIELPRPVFRPSYMYSYRQPFMPTLARRMPMFDDYETYEDKSALSMTTHALQNSRDKSRQALAAAIFRLQECIMKDGVELDDGDVDIDELTQCIDELTQCRRNVIKMVTRLKEKRMLETEIEMEMRKPPNEERIHPRMMHHRHSPKRRRAISMPSHVARHREFLSREARRQEEGLLLSAVSVTSETTPDRPDTPDTPMLERLDQSTHA